MSTGISALDTGSFNQLVLHVENTTITGFDYGIVTGPASSFAVWAFGSMTVRNSVSFLSFRGFTALGKTEADLPGPANMMIEKSIGSHNYVAVVAAGHSTNQTGTARITLAGSNITFSEFKVSKFNRTARSCHAGTTC